METAPLISLHGGHSGQFCCHARDDLKAIVQRYIARGFACVGITEHIPPVDDTFLYPEERAQGFSAQDMLDRFGRYMETIRELQERFAPKIRIYAGMETETCTGYLAHVQKLVTRFQPDYLVGSVHHVRDISFDYSEREYEKAVEACGSHDALYLEYFDLQYEMILNLKPFVVGHFDLIRIHDLNHEPRLKTEAVQERIHRNLALIREFGLVLDFNLRPLSRGEALPYLAQTVLDMAGEYQIPVVPGDDSHSTEQAGAHVARAVRMLSARGFDTNWPEPGRTGKDLT